MAGTRRCRGTRRSISPGGGHLAVLFNPLPIRPSLWPPVNRRACCCSRRQHAVSRSLARSRQSPQHCHDGCRVEGPRRPHRPALLRVLTHQRTPRTCSVNVRKRECTCGWAFASGPFTSCLRPEPAMTPPHQENACVFRGCGSEKARGFLSGEPISTVCPDRNRVTGTRTVVLPASVNDWVTTTWVVMKNKVAPS